MQEWNPSSLRARSSARPGAAGEIQEHERLLAVRAGRLEWWYRLTTPTEATKPSRRERALARRARLSSTLLLIITVIWFTAIPVFLLTVSSDPTTIPITVVGLAVIALLLFFNRQGWVAGVAWLLIGMIDLSVVLILLRQRGLNTGEVAIIDLMVYTELIAVSLLPAINVFLVALGNSAFILIAIFVSHPPSSDFSQPLFITNLVVEPITLQLFVAVVTYLWVASTERAMARADQAELVAALERRRSEERRQLEGDIQQLLETLTRAANGDSSARASLSQDHALWQVGMALNLLLTRMQRGDQSEQTLQHLDVEVSLVVRAIQENKAGRSIRWPAPSGSLLDPIIRELARATSHSTSSEHPSAKPTLPPGE